MELLERRLCLSEKKIGGTLTTVACASGGGRYIRASPRCARVSYSPPACSLGCRMRRCTSRTFTHTHTPGAVFQARLPDNQESAMYRTMYAFGKLSAICFQRLTFYFWQRRHYSNRGDVEHGKIGRGVCGTRHRCVR